MKRELILMCGAGLIEKQKKKTSNEGGMIIFIGEPLPFVNCFIMTSIQLFSESIQST